MGFWIKGVFVLLLLAALAGVSPWMWVKLDLYLMNYLGKEYVLQDKFDIQISGRKLEIPKSEFWISVPEIGAVSKIERNIDIQNDRSYSSQLTAGYVIHSKSSDLPGQLGTMLLVTHPTNREAMPWVNPRYYFLDRLQKGDQIIIGYKNKVYNYEITSTKVIESYPDLSDDNSSSNLILLSSSPFSAGIKLQISAKLRPQT
jgi:hypothetical protein